MRFPRLNAARIIHATLMWSKAFVPVIALFAAAASSIRTVQTTAEIYTAAGSPPGAVILAAAAFTISAEGALFVLGLAQENQRIKWRQARKKRHVTSLKSIAQSLLVRIGMAEPLSYDQMPENDSGLSTIIWIAFAFTIASNLYLGLKPLTEQAGDASLQSFIASILNASARVQLMLIVDIAGVLFPPLMALKAGQLTARFASEVMTSQTRQSAKVERVVKTPPEQRSAPVQEGAAERVIEHLNGHPEDRDLSQRQLAKKLKVSVGTVNNVIKTAVHENGHKQL